MSIRQDIAKLYDIFGRPFKESQATLWIQQLENKFSPQAVTDAVNYIVKYSDTFPSLARLLEACRSMEGKKDVEKYKCEYCHGTGRVTVKRTVITGEGNNAQLNFSYRCRCSNAERFNNFPIVEKGWLQNKIAPTVFESDMEAIDLTKDDSRKKDND